LKVASNIDIRDAFFDEVYHKASTDKDVVFITADADAFSLQRYRKDFPNQFINIGIAEQSMIAVAAGLALSGKNVFIYAIIPFVTMRCFEHIKVNICSMNLPITIVGGSAGFSIVYSGPTHHAVHDIAVMRVLPEITILNPPDGPSAAVCAGIAYESRGPVYIRVDKGTLPLLYDNDEGVKAGFNVLKPLTNINIVSTGFMTHKVMDVAEELKKHSIDVGVLDLLRLKPVDSSSFMELLGESECIVTVEENSIVGGLGTIVSEILCDTGSSIRLKRIALDDKQHFAYGSREWLHHHYGLSVESITNVILEEIVC
jgi:transketolase